MEKTKIILEYQQILKMLSDRAVSEQAREQLMKLMPTLGEDECCRRMEETTCGRRMLETLGTPPLAMMTNIDEIVELCEIDGVLSPEQLEETGVFITASKRMIGYLKKAKDSGYGLGNYAGIFTALTELETAIAGSIRSNQVDDYASVALKKIRGKIDTIQGKIKEKLESMLRKDPSCFADNYVLMRNGRYVLPVNKSNKSRIPGTTVDISASRNTLFIEPVAAARLREELDNLRIEEENEIYRILCQLTDMVAAALNEIKQNIEGMLALDLIFARAKLSLDMEAREVPVTCTGQLRIIEGRHPLLDKDTCVPLDFYLDDQERGIIITGPNTGGKTVTLKTIGLLSMMAQAGLHIPVKEGSCFRMHNLILCDIGDGQSISENLSTFSSHLTNIIQILNRATDESLVLLDELGSGTDPAEGMGIAISILEALRSIGCRFIATTHYPEVKDYAIKTPGLINARMAFDKENLRPLYRLEIGEAGESCALYIARRLGYPEQLLEIATHAAYKKAIPDNRPRLKKNHPPQQLKPASVTLPEANDKTYPYKTGDSVLIRATNEIGIVYQPADDKGYVNVQIKGIKQKILHKRLKLHVPASELYPDDYDFSIIFDTVEQRKARHAMSKKYQKDLTLEYTEE